MHPELLLYPELALVVESFSCHRMQVWPERPAFPLFFVPTKPLGPGLGPSLVPGPGLGPGPGPGLGLGAGPWAQEFRGPFGELSGQKPSGGVFPEILKVVPGFGKVRFAIFGGRNPWGRNPQEGWSLKF